MENVLQHPIKKKMFVCFLFVLCVFFCFALFYAMIIWDAGSANWIEDWSFLISWSGKWKIIIPN